MLACVVELADASFGRHLPIPLHHCDFAAISACCRRLSLWGGARGCVSRQRVDCFAVVRAAVRFCPRAPDARCCKPGQPRVFSARCLREAFLKGACRGRISPWCVFGRPAVARLCRGAFPGARRWQNAREMRLPASDSGKMSPRCVPRLPALAVFRRDAFPGGDPWQFFRLMRSRRGLGREKRRFVATFRRHASETGWFWQDMRVMHPKSPANSRLGMHRAKILPLSGPFPVRDPRITHGGQILPFLGASFERFDLSRAGRLAVRASLAGRLAVRALLPPCVGWRGCFAGSPTRNFELSPHLRVRCSRCRAAPRALPPRPRRTVELAARVPDAPAPVRVATELAVACRLPQKTWRCDGVSLNCRCSAVLF